MRCRQVNAGRLWAIMGALLLASSCDSHPLENSCLYNGSSHARGESFPSADGCNTCSCSGSGVACTLRACLPDAGTSDAPIDASPVDTGPSDGPASCQVGEHIYAAGVFFPTDDGCNMCMCQPSIGAACTARACPPGSPEGLGCSFPHTYRFRDDGGLGAYADSSTLGPPHTHTLVRDHLGNALPNQCNRDVVCVDPTLVDVVEILQALAHPDVVAALAETTRPFYGQDTRPVDGSVFMFDRDDGRGFTVGSGAVPAGLSSLVDLLHRLDQQTATTPACAGL
jgi:Pacifastin inhibitor (LCMII)